MYHRTISALLLLASLGLAAITVGAQERGLNGEGSQGSELVTQEERRAYRERMQNAQSAEERQQIRAEHQQLIQQRIEQRKMQQQRKQVHEPGTRGGTGAGKRKGGTQSESHKLRGKGKKR